MLDITFFKLAFPASQGTPAKAATILSAVVLVTCFLLSSSRPTVAQLGTQVTTSFDGETYYVDLDSRYEYYSSFGWRSVFFNVKTLFDLEWHLAFADCGPYAPTAVGVPVYGWDLWSSSGLSAGTVEGQIARAACYW